MASEPIPAVLQHLATATAEHPLDRKLLVCSSVGAGRELLRALGRHGTSWIGWDVTTPRRLAMDLVAPELAAEGLAVADPYAEESAVDTALDRALEASELHPIAPLAETPGFRQAVLNAIQALRLASVDAPRLRDVARSGALSDTLLVRVLDGYREELDRQSLVDTAAVLERALDAVGIRSDALDPADTYLVPGLRRHGATGRLIQALLDNGAIALRADPVRGSDPPPVLWVEAVDDGPFSGILAGAAGTPPPADRLDLFAASGPADEIREVIRRVMAQGLQWDDVEIIATDPVVYGSALHGLAERLGVPVSYAVGLPVERTRPGRAATEYFRWIRAGYPSEILRRLLEAGDLEAPAGTSGLQLARRLRTLRIGWGHDRYLPAIDRALDRTRDPRPRRKETEAEAANRAERERTELDALRALIAPIIESTPRLERGGRGEPVSPAELARGLEAFLGHVASADDPSATARDRLLGIAGRVAATLTRPTEPAAALGQLRRHLEIRVPAPLREGAAPWVSAGGHIHLSDLDHGGYSARLATFIVGLDADRFPGTGLQDPLLLDAQRRALDPEALPTSGDRLAARRFALAACLARLRGRVTLSYSAWEPTEARGVAPASVLLDAYRAASGRADASFEDLRADLGNAASPVARTGAIDGADVWFSALEKDGVLQRGTGVVREAFPHLDAGLRAAEALAGDEATAWHGRIEPRPGLDPRGSDERVLSASGLEDLGTCGLRYFYKYALGIRPHDDPEVDPDVWLDALERGSLLHSVFEATLREARVRDIEADDPAFVELALETLAVEAQRTARRVPPPGETIREREIQALRADVRSFCRMMEGEDGRWIDLELRFGLFGEPPAALPLKGGDLLLRGAIDRLDETDDGLVVVDYKTGGTTRHERRLGVFNGGRRLQNVVYATVAERLREAHVARMEYHFPTRRGQNERIAYDRDELRRGLGLIDRLMEAVADGRFLPTEDPKDCTFCDYAPICRHRTEGWSQITPRADWAADHLELPVFQERRETRDWETTFLAELEAHGEEA